MSIHVMSPESARVAIAYLDSFPSEGEDIPPWDSALTAHGAASRANADLWHHRLGHLNDEAVLKMVKKGDGKGHGDHRRLDTHHALRTLPQREANPCRDRKVHRNPL
jgi:hypothetical protein